MTVAGVQTPSKPGPYSAYHPSDVDWLGEIPAHWELIRLKYVAPAVNEKLDQKPEDLPYVGLEQIESGTGKVTLDETIENVDSSVVSFQKGDVLFGKLRPYLAKVVHPDFDGVGTGELLVLRPTSRAFSGFVFYLVLSPGFIDTINSLTYGTRMPRANADQVGGQLVALPPLQEQHAIASFLDRETARIDTLIAKKERLIELLQEKRTALLSHAVTKGLDPDVEMKDSGVEWLGEVPGHWEILPFKRVTERVVVGIAEAATHAYMDEGVPIIRSTNVRPNELRVDELLHIDAAFAEKNRSKYIRGRDIVTVRTGNAGISAVVPEELDGSQCFTLLISTPRAGHSADFYCYYLNSEPGRVSFQLEGWGTAQVNISVPILQEALVVAPPFDEQREIVAFIQSESADAAKLMQVIEENIERLKEYRTALISAAVTGKINVQHWSA